MELLSEYLESEKDQVTDSKNEEIEISLIVSSSKSSIFISEICMTSVQEQLIKNIVANSFQIHQDEVDKFAIENGMFKNQLIDIINEACEEYLEGEALIEEDVENYIIEESYYKEILI